MQLIATLGPSSRHLARELAAAGATGFRLNCSHLDLADARAIATEVAAASELPLVFDLQGAKMRLGQIEARSVLAGERVRFSECPEHPGDIPLPHPELFASAQPGDLLSLDDDRLRVRVLAVEANALTAECLKGGMLQAKKGVNRVEHPVELRDLSPRDEALCSLAAQLPHCACAFSFMRDGREAAWLRARAPGLRVIGKVERREALANLEQIASAVDTVWICRGDLGAQLGPLDLARFVSSFTPRAHRVPVLMAGQVLEHLTAHGTPTRSEVCHLYDLVARGYAGIVLSDETAIGSDPVQAVSVASELWRSFANLE